MCCGTGAAISHLRPLCRDRVVGIDLSRGMLAVARQRTQETPGALPSCVGMCWRCRFARPSIWSSALAPSAISWPRSRTSSSPSRARAQAWGPVRVCHNPTATMVVGAVLARPGVQCPHARAKWAPDAPFYYVLSDLSLAGSRHAAAPTRLCRDRVRGYVSRPFSTSAARDRDLDRPGAGVTLRSSTRAARSATQPQDRQRCPYPLTVPPVSAAPDVQAIIQQAAQQALAAQQTTSREQPAAPRQAPDTTPPVRLAGWRRASGSPPAAWEPQRGGSGRWRQVAAGGCWAATDSA